MLPAGVEEDFLTGYRSGRQLYELNAAVNAVSGQISNKRYALRQLTETQSAKEAALIDSKTLVLLALPMAASADYVDVIEFKLNEGCTFATEMQIVKDFNT